MRLDFRAVKEFADEQYNEVLRRQRERMMSENPYDDFLEEGSEEEVDAGADDPELLIETEEI